MRLGLTFWCIPFLAALAASAESEREVPPDYPVAQWIEDLASDVFELRESATRGLQDLGEPVWPFLRPYLHDPDGERQLRVRALGEVKCELESVVLSRGSEAVWPLEIEMPAEPGTYSLMVYYEADLLKTPESEVRDWADEMNGAPFESGRLGGILDGFMVARPPAAGRGTFIAKTPIFSVAPCLRGE